LTPRPHVLAWAPTRLLPLPDPRGALRPETTRAYRWRERFGLIAGNGRADR
jgi:hypothetical protein